ncbi:MAG: tripartite tricarboxylate transporter substrate binding protein [Rhodospirillales bacterium]|nr:tripartite tricarboxylate transporter substrate binding protein [Rhodospirillales bacterium]
MRKLLKQELLGVTVAAIAAILAAPVSAADYPDKPIKLVVASGAGGSTDTAARIMAINIQEHIGQPIIVVNKKGGSGGIGINFALKAKPDGYLLMEGMIGGHVLFPAMNTSAGYTPDDYTPIAMTQMNPNVLVVKADSPYKNLKDLLRAIKANPGKLKFSHAGAGSIHYFGIHLLLKTAGIANDSAIAIPYKGGSKSMAGLLRGEANFHQTNLVSAIDFIKSGKVRALAVTTKERLKSFPNVPTYAELGYPNVDIFGWRGVIGPKDLPKAIVDQWAKAVQDTMARKGWKKMVKAVGDMPRYMGPEEFSKLIASDFKRYRQMATDLDILVQ